jgi:hypothetical protein
MSTTTNQIEAKSNLLTKIANMILYEVPNRQIAAACGLSESRLSQLIATEDYKLVEEEIATEHFESQQVMNKGWDALEQISLNCVLQAMQMRPDPEFAMKAAMLANRATRRGSLNHTPIPGNAGVRTVIQLNAHFVDKLQQNFTISNEREGRQAVQVEQHRVSMLPQAKVTELLSPKSMQVSGGLTGLANLLGDFNLQGVPA